MQPGDHQGGGSRITENAMSGGWGQFIAILHTELSATLSRPRHAALAFVGFAVVVFVLVSLLAIVSGLRKAARQSGSPSTAIVMKTGSLRGIDSILTSDATGIVSSLPGVARRDGRPMVSPALVITAKIPRRSDGVSGSVLVKGVTDAAFALAGDMHLVRGRRFQAGTNEIIAGQAAARAFRWLTPGQAQKFAHARWKTVGTFSDKGGYGDSAILTDLHTLQSAAHAEGLISLVTVQLTSADAYPAFAHAVRNDKRLAAHAMRQTDYYARQTRIVDEFISIAIAGIAILLGAGTIVGVMNITSTALLSRQRELALYRSLGFQRGAVISALLADTVLIGLVGGLAGGIIAKFAFDGYLAVTSTVMHQLAFALSVSSTTIVTGVVYALSLALLSGIAPAWQAGRRSVVAGLR